MHDDNYSLHHQHPVNKAAHMIGIPIIVIGAVLALWPSRLPFGVRRSNAIACCAAGWMLLWLGHVVEGNRPVILSRPSSALDALKWWSRTAVFR
jgi:uncharacterized membrane protein YGL010W